MRYVLFFITLGFLATVSFAQSKSGSRQEDKTSAKKTVSLSTQTAVAQQETKKVSDKSEEKQMDDYSQSEVLIDKMSYENDNIAYSDNEGNPESDPDALPYAYGQIRGVVNMDGKSIIVLEGDDGSINFIYVYNDRGKMKWKLYGKIKRNY